MARALEVQGPFLIQEYVHGYFTSKALSFSPSPAMSSAGLEEIIDIGNNLLGPFPLPHPWLNSPDLSAPISLVLQDR